MKQWEYKIDIFVGDNNNELEYLNNLGKEGWELVKVEYSDNRYYGRYIFKREIK